MRDGSWTGAILGRLNLVVRASQMVKLVRRRLLLLLMTPVRVHSLTSRQHRVRHVSNCQTYDIPFKNYPPCCQVDHFVPVDLLSVSVITVESSMMHWYMQLLQLYSFRLLDMFLAESTSCPFQLVVHVNHNWLSKFVPLILWNIRFTSKTSAVNLIFIFHCLL